MSKDIDLSVLPERWQTALAWEWTRANCDGLLLQLGDALAVALGAMRPALDAFNLVLAAQQRILFDLLDDAATKDTATRRVHVANQRSIEFKARMTDLRDAIREIKEMGDE